MAEQWRIGRIAHRQEVVEASCAYGARGQTDSNRDSRLAFPVEPALNLWRSMCASTDRVKNERLVDLPLYNEESLVLADPDFEQAAARDARDIAYQPVEEVCSLSWRVQAAWR